MDIGRAAPRPSVSPLPECTRSLPAAEMLIRSATSARASVRVEWQWGLGDAVSVLLGCHID